MPNYLGKTTVEISTHPIYKDYTPADWAMYHIERYGGIDGAHHKTWVLDQVARILKGAPITLTHRSWDDGQAEYNADVGTSPEYESWVQESLGEYDEETECYEYNYDEGIPP